MTPNHISQEIFDLIVKTYKPHNFLSLYAREVSVDFDGKSWKLYKSYGPNVSLDSIRKAVDYCIKQYDIAQVFLIPRVDQRKYVSTTPMGAFILVTME